MKNNFFKNKTGLSGEGNFSFFICKKWVLCIIICCSCLTACVTDVNQFESKHLPDNTIEDSSYVEEATENIIYTTFESAIVTEVIDGDTIKIDTGEKVRLILVNCPESVHTDKSKNTEFGKVASEYTKKILLGKKVYLEKDISETDRYDRLLRYVYLEDGTFFNEKLVKEGYAQLSTFPPDIKYQDIILNAERHAREHELGLWHNVEYITVENAKFIASKKGEKYHDLICVYGKKIIDVNVLYFRTADDAESDEYLPCSRCIE